jgi:starch synthase
LFTIHNLAFQGLFPERTFASLRLPNDLFTPDGIEFHGQISFLKAGIRYSDRLTTVSPSYAREILTPEFGCGLDGLLRARASELNGIVNGIDDQLWNPAVDPHVPGGFSVDSMTGKSRCKEELRRELGLASAPQMPLLVWGSRITHQKMVDTVLEVLPALLDRDIQLALIGQGEADAERALVDHAIASRAKMAVRIGYDESLAHRFYAAGDLLLHPSRFEPCGFAALYAMRYALCRSCAGSEDCWTTSWPQPMTPFGTGPRPDLRSRMPMVLLCSTASIEPLLLTPNRWCGGESNGKR